LFRVLERIEVFYAVLKFHGQWSNDEDVKADQVREGWRPQELKTSNFGGV
jgi:hypothetical protein